MGAEGSGLESSYRVVPLARAHVLPAYPLVHAFRPDLTLAEWRSESAGHLDGGGAACGALVAESVQGHLTGVALHRLVPGALAVDCFAVLALVDAFGIAGALLGRLEAVARAAGCGEVRVLLPQRGLAAGPAEGRSRTTAAAFAFAGYGPVGIVHRKRLG